MKDVTCCHHVALTPHSHKVAATVPAPYRDQHTQKELGLFPQQLFLEGEKVLPKGISTGFPSGLVPKSIPAQRSETSGSTTGKEPPKPRTADIRKNLSFINKKVGTAIVRNQQVTLVPGNSAFYSQTHFPSPRQIHPKKYLCFLCHRHIAPVRRLPSAASLTEGLQRPQPGPPAPGHATASTLNVTAALGPDHTFLFQRVIPDAHNSCSVDFLFSTLSCQQFSRDGTLMHFLA